MGLGVGIGGLGFVFGMRLRNEGLIGNSGWCSYLSNVAALWL